MGSVRRGLSRCAAGSSANGRDGAAPRTLYKGRRILLKTASLRTDRQKARADDLLTDPANKPLALAHGAYQKIISCYAHEDRRKGRGMMAELIESLAVKSGAPGCPELATLGRTLKRRMGDVFAFFDHPNGANGPTEAINGIKAGLMGPFAGIGDTIDWSTLRPLLIALVLPLAENGSFLAPIIYGILLGGITFAENMFFVKTGYRMGTQAALSVLEGGAINKFISCASVLGMFMMGGLSASMVNVYTTAQIPTGEGTVMAIQGDILDAVAPGLLTLFAVLMTYRYLRSGHSMMKATFWILGIGLVLGAVGIIGDGGFLIKPIMDLTAAA